MSLLPHTRNHPERALGDQSGPDPAQHWTVRWQLMPSGLFPITRPLDHQYARTSASIGRLSGTVYRPARSVPAPRPDRADPAHDLPSGNPTGSPGFIRMSAQIGRF